MAHKRVLPSHSRVFRAALLRRGDGWKWNAGRLQARRRARKANQTHAAEPDQFGFSFVYYCVLPLPLPLPGSANDPSSSHGLRAARCTAARRAALACLRVVCSALLLLADADARAPHPRPTTRLRGSSHSSPIFRGPPLHLNRRRAACLLPAAAVPCVHRVVVLWMWPVSSRVPVVRAVFRVVQACRERERERESARESREQRNCPRRTTARGARESRWLPEAKRPVLLDLHSRSVAS